jgi:hypothetical protein
MTEPSAIAAARAPLSVGDEVTAFIDLTSAQVSLVRTGEDSYRVVALDCYARALRESGDFGTEDVARTYARQLTEELRQVWCQTSPITTRVRRAA